MTEQIVANFRATPLRPCEVQFTFDPPGGHNEQSWSRRFPDAILFDHVHHPRPLKDSSRSTTRHVARRRQERNWRYFSSLCAVLVCPPNRKRRKRAGSIDIGKWPRPAAAAVPKPRRIMPMTMTPP